MKKNVVFIHLESLNQAIFSKSHWFPCIEQVLRHSVSLNNFISTATSSVMALSDLVHGDDNVMEHNTQIEVNATVKREGKTLFDQLKAAGYETAGVGYPQSWGCVDRVWSDDQKFQWSDTADEMMANAERIISKSDPFALYFWNLSSHLCYADGIKHQGENSFERWKKGYQSMDATVGMIVQSLIRHGKLENTIIVAFGDHGDDFWNHGFNGGFAHSIEPYTSLVHTPAFIFHPDAKIRNINHLVSLLDIKEAILKLIDDNSDTQDRYLENLALKERTYCFSRNLFANQKGPVEGNPLNKGYAITSEYFHLMKINHEYKMYAWQADAGNQLNLLSLIKESKMDLTQVAKQRAQGVHPHMLHFFGGDADAVISDAFSEMKQRLDNWIESKQRFCQQG